MENASSNNISSLSGREQDRSSDNLIIFLKNKIENDQEDKPWWFDDMDRISNAVARLSSARTSELVSDRENKCFSYPIGIKEALGGIGLYNGRLNYSVIKQEGFLQFNTNGKLPTKSQDAVDQLFVTQWTIFGESKGGGIPRQLQKIRDHMLVDLPFELKEIYVSEPDKKTSVIAGLKNKGNAMDSWDIDSLTVQLQEVYWDKGQGRPVAGSVLSLRVSEVVNGKYYATIRGMDPTNLNDERKYEVPKNIAENFRNRFDRFFK